MPLRLADYLQPESATGYPKLSPEEERLFQAWWRAQADALGLAPDPDDPLQAYDLRGAYQAGATPVPDPTDLDPVTGRPRPHWTSVFKGEGHPTRYLPRDGGGGFYDTATGADATLEEMLGDTRLKRRWR